MTYKIEEVDMRKKLSVFNYKIHKISSNKSYGVSTRNHPGTISFERIFHSIYQSIPIYT